MLEPPTLRDIAERLGLGKSTVQRVLTGTGKVSASTRKRIVEAAIKLGYQPNTLFSILGSQKRRHTSKSVKVAYVYRKSVRLGVDYYPAAAERGKILGYSVDRIELEQFAAGPRFMDVLYHQGYMGVLLGRIQVLDHTAILKNIRLPVVSCGRIEPLPLHTVQADMSDMVRLAWRSMIKAGYRRIGPAIRSHVPAIEDDLDRYGTVLQCQQDTLAPSDRIPPLRARIGDQGAVLEWFNQHKPDAVLGFAISDYYVLKHAGVDMSTIGYVSLHGTEVSDSFSGIIEPVASISREALNLLDQLIRHRSVGIPEEPLHILIPGNWLPGFTLPVKVDQRGGATYSTFPDISTTEITPLETFLINGGLVRILTAGNNTPVYVHCSDAPEIVGGFRLVFADYVRPKKGEPVVKDVPLPIPSGALTIVDRRHIVSERMKDAVVTYMMKSFHLSKTSAQHVILRIQEGAFESVSISQV